MSIARERTSQLAALLRREHEAMADFLVALADFDAKRLWSELGYASLFDFLYRELRLSKSAAHYRKVAAELIRRCPPVVDRLRDGSLCFSSVIELAKVVTPENVGEVLPRFLHRSKREAMQVVAEILPMERPPVRDVVTLPTASLPLAGVVISAASAAGSPEQSVVVERRLSLDLHHPPVQPEELVDAKLPVASRGFLSQANAEQLIPRVATESPPHFAARAATRDTERTVSDPLTAELCRLHVTIPTKALEKIDAARALISHAKPNASTGEILDAALDVLLEKLARMKRLATKQKKGANGVAPSPKETIPEYPADSPPPSIENKAPSERPDTPGRRRREYIPAHVRRAVWERDGGRCTFPLQSGGVCGSTYQLELDHVTPVALGGTSTIENLRIACKRHNLDAARSVFGDEYVDACIRRRRAGGGSGRRVAAGAEDGP